MNELTSSERNQIKQIVTSPQFATVQRLANLMCQKIALNPKMRETEWETLSRTLLDEGEVSGIQRLLQELFNEAQK